jgi:phosphoglycolate phosphatase
MTMSHLRLIVFDVDGTLIDSQHHIVAAMTEAWAGLGLGTPLAADVRRIIGLSLVDACRMLLPWASPDLHRAVAEAYRDAFQALSLRPDLRDPLFPGAVEAMDRLEAEGCVLGLATGKSRRGVARMLETHGLDGRFVTIQTPDDNPGKPDPAMLLRAAAETGVAVENVAMVGDTVYDVQMARAARALAIGVSWGYHAMEDLRLAGARLVLDGFDTLADHLALLMGEG